MKIMKKEDFVNTNRLFETTPEEIENDLFYINVPFLSDFIVLTFLPNQVEIFN